MAVRLKIKTESGTPEPWPIGQLRVYQVGEDGSETEITEIVDCSIRFPVGEPPVVMIQTWLTRPFELTAAGRVVVLCPNCEEEQAAPCEHEPGNTKDVTSGEVDCRKCGAMWRP